MIAADTSTWIAFFSGAEGEDVERLDDALQDRLVMMPPPVLSELLSDPKLSADLETALREVPLLTRDRDFIGFADAAGLDLVVGRQ